ncbi:MAG: glycosyl hydrolase 2 galactose-binding domain-containing protein, partial [Planctomycetota bacterium]
MKTTAALALLVLMASAALADDVVPLNGEWETGWAKDATYPPKVGKWEKTTVPHLTDFPLQERYLWYRRTFPGAGNRRAFFLLRFEGVKFSAKVFLNGNEVGSHVGGFVPFEFDVTGSVHRDRENVVEVVVRDLRACAVPESIPDAETAIKERLWGFLFSDRMKLWYPVGSQSNQCGIWQDVSLVGCWLTRVKDIFVRPSVREKKVDVTVTIGNAGGMRAL